MTQRLPDLQSLLTLAEAAIHQASDAEGPLRSTSAQVFMALRTPATQATPAATARLPVCRHLPAALDDARRQPAPIGALADAFGTIEPLLKWQIRPDADMLGEPFLSGHANAIIIGADGLEVRNDVRIGVSLMAPETQYPDHRHPPEEIYVVLSSGQWRQADRPWHEPGIGGLVHNSPNVVHAMRASKRPLLAMWFLWTGAGNTTIAGTV